MNNAPELLIMSRVAWQLFATFTTKSAKTPDAELAKMWFAVLRKTASNLGVHYHSLIWCLRLEFGETTGRKHLHALIAGLPEHTITERSCFATMSLWESIGGGMARVRVYDRSLAGVDYVLKGFDLIGANFHEFSKFKGAERLTLSESFIRVIDRTRGERRGRQHRAEGSKSPSV